MTKMEELRDRFAAIPRERFINPTLRENAEPLARLWAIFPELEGYSIDEVRKLEMELSVEFPSAFREWMLLFGKSYVELTDWEFFFVSQGVGELLDFKTFRIEVEAGPKYSWQSCLRGGGGDDSPIYRISGSWSKGTTMGVISPSFTDYIECEIRRYEGLPEAVTIPSEVIPRPEPIVLIPPAKQSRKQSRWSKFLEFLGW